MQVWCLTTSISVSKLATSIEANQQQQDRIAPYVSRGPDTKSWRNTEVVIAPVWLLLDLDRHGLQDGAGQVFRRGLEADRFVHFRRTRLVVGRLQPHQEPVGQSRAGYSLLIVCHDYASYGRVYLNSNPMSQRSSSTIQPPPAKHVRGVDNNDRRQIGL